MAEIPEGLQPDDLLEYLLANVTPNQLVANRTAQARIYRTLSDAPDHGAPGNFWLREPPSNRYVYRIPDWHMADTTPFLRPQDIVPSGLRTRTLTYEALWQASADLGVLPTDIHSMRFYNRPELLPYYTYEDVPFDNELLRMPAGGGAQERYNYVRGEWEATGNAYHPRLHIRAAEGLRRVLHRGFTTGRAEDVTP